MSTVNLSKGAGLTLGVLAAYHGVTKRHIVESLLHYAASCMERPGSWEAQGFDLKNYAADGFADRWFDKEKTYVDPYS